MISIQTFHFVAGWFGFTKTKQNAVLQDAWEEDHDEQTSVVNLEARTSALRLSRLSRRSRRSLRSITSIKREIKHEKMKEKIYEFTPQDHSIYSNSKVFNTDMSFLTINDELDDKYVEETLNKFIHCVNFLNSDSSVKEKKKLSNVMN